MTVFHIILQVSWLSHMLPTFSDSYFTLVSGKKLKIQCFKFNKIYKKGVFSRFQNYYFNERFDF